MTRAERAEILRLVEEGRQIAQIARRFRHLDYADVYWAARGEGQRSALGTKRMISNRLISLEDADDEAKEALIQEISELVWKLYQNHMASSAKLATIRSALDA